MSVKNRLNEYLKFKNIRKSHFEKSINVSNGYINSLSGSPSANKINDISKVYNDLNIEWLLTGEGEMIKLQGKSLDASFEKKEDQWSRAEESESHYNVTPIDNDNYMIVEYADLRVSAGPLGTKNLNALPKNKTRLVPKEYDKGDYMVLRVDGPSMDNGTSISIPDGTEILVKKYYLHNGDKLPIRNNLFVIDAKDGQALKQIIEHNTEEGYIICHSYNPEFKDYKVMMEDILQIFIYRKIVSSRPPIPDIK